MSIISEIRVLSRPVTPTVVVRGTGVPFAELEEFFDSAFGTLGALIQRGLLIPTGPAFALYHGVPPEALDVEVGFPVAAPVDSSDTSGASSSSAASTTSISEALRAAGAETSELPGGQRATATLRGGYDLLSQAWTELMEGLAAQGLKPGMPYWENYVTMPEPEGDPAENVTELVVPVE
ncbi:MULTISPECIES: GyrI-like domain-containing protein [unclassified Corynebacterium]|uniref:GyrI-like domain-containing protein n=1 Tax=unclassified Corynebacterium TaxID=2624378 RepID=UPI0029CA76AE|nr:MULTISPECIES: GyrI-like domain-containing protein [unclassified Corynebacterium]WPF66919.1 GyrI-like domain-containing protein [Corynebacterium sp. 22KM0430]WPF69406.1 GyrI-like domain-containing protein [Corynebacterium sp. 21KM1197]